MAIQYLPRISNDLDAIDNGGGAGGGTGFVSAVANYSALPAAGGVSGYYYWVSAIDVVGGVKYPAGAYRSNGTTWEFDTAYSQAAVWGDVANYAALPLGTTSADPQIGDLVGVNASQGTWILGTQRREGYYKRSAMTGVAATDYGTAPFAGFSESATQAQMDAGTSTDVFGSPSTVSSVIQNATYTKGTASGTDTYTVTLTPAPSAYVSGQTYEIIFTNAPTGASTLNVNSLGAKTLVKNGGTAISSGDWGAGQALIVHYDGTNFQIIGLGGGGGAVTFDTLPDEAQLSIINAFLFNQNFN